MFLFSNIATGVLLWILSICFEACSPFLSGKGGKEHEHEKIDALKEATLVF